MHGASHAVDNFPLSMNVMWVCTKVTQRERANTSMWAKLDGQAHATKAYDKAQALTMCEGESERECVCVCA